ncbi:37903fe5-d32f-472f-8cbe-292c7e276d08 [Thermothielavioides terrestris]|uniref:37903fe5-d32f-472f-8cbe-292c7e276d08 n=1 Tax=Thermothielavioides terrestris TaxID=2587410 RepID=A0A446B873_9PEZI|nr:37903fe5-d32f-472f-8cbe-292c7e276d08 [Thermothielavioides terrestris]
MSSLAADVTFDFNFPPCGPTTPPSYTFDPSLLEIPYNPGHARSSSHGSVYSLESSPSDSVTAPSTRRTTPARSPIRTHGPLLLPKIRSQDQAIMPSNAVPHASKRARTSPGPVGPNKSAFRPSHTRSHTSPEAISFSSGLSCPEDSNPAPLLCSPVSFTREPSVMHSRRASSCSVDNVATADNYFPAYQVPAYVPARASSSPTPPPQVQAVPQPEPFLYQQFVPRAPSPLAAAAPITPDVVPATTLYAYLTSPNPTPSLVRTLSFPLRDPNTRHFWWDVRQIRPWTGFTAASILSLPGASACLSMPVSSALLPNPAATQRHPETEAALHAIYAAHYLPKLNNALALCSQRPLKLSVPPKTGGGAHSLGMATDCMFVANAAGESGSAAALFGGKPTARVVGLVKSFDRFNTGMRAEGNVKRVEYLRGLAHLHHAMREHGCRYGFILTEIELVVVRNGVDATPYFGFLEVASVQLAAADDVAAPADADDAALTACLALWGLCMLAGDEPMPGHAHWRADIGAPADGTRRKALPRDDWMPQPQLAEKREAKRARGWILPECPVSRKEVGKRGVRYGAC